MPKKILVVDDDRNIGQILYVSFKSKGYETVIAKNGEEALRLFSEQRPDLVLLDVLLPKMNGWEVCQRIKATDEGKSTPIVLMSAIYKSYKLQADARQKYGADDFVEKPFQLAALLEKIASYIGAGDADPDAAAPGPEPAPPVVAPPPPADEPISDTGIHAVLEGELGDFAFPSLLHKIHVLGRSGILYLTAGEKSKEVAFKEGYPVSVKTNIEGEFLGRYLVGIRKITDEQCEESLKRMERTGRLQGTVLIEMELLTPNELVRYLKLQMVTKIFEVFGWPDGRYQFVEDDTVVGDISNIDVSPANIIYRGIVGRFGLERLIAFVDGYGDRYLARSSNMFYRFQDLDLANSEVEFLSRIDGSRMVRDILAESELDLDKTYQLLYTLLVTEMYEPLTEPIEKRDEMPLQVDEPADEGPEIPDYAEILREADQPTDPAAVPIAAPPPPAEEPDDDAIFVGEPGLVDDDAPSSIDLDTDEVQIDEPEPDEASAVDTEDAELRRKILDKYGEIESQNHFEVLGLADTATEHDVRVAYHRMAKEYHPDRFFGRTSAAIKEKGEEIFSRISDAYARLDSESAIESYRKELEEGTDAKTSAKMEGVKAIIRAERSYQTGVQLVRDRNWEKAVSTFREAMTDAPNEPEYQAYYGWAMFNHGRQLEAKSGSRKGEAARAQDLQFQARENLNRAIAANPRLEKGYVFLGYVYKAQGMREFAERQFEKALITNPNCTEALRELRLMRLADQRARAKKKNVFEKFADRVRKYFKR